MTTHTGRRRSVQPRSRQARAVRSAPTVSYMVGDRRIERQPHNRRMAAALCGPVRTRSRTDQPCQQYGAAGTPRPRSFIRLSIAVNRMRPSPSSASPAERSPQPRTRTDRAPRACACAIFRAASLAQHVTMRSNPRKMHLPQRHRRSDEPWQHEHRIHSSPIPVAAHSLSPSGPRIAACVVSTTNIRILVPDPGSASRPSAVRKMAGHSSGRMLTGASPRCHDRDPRASAPSPQLR